MKMESGLLAVILNPGFMLGPWDWKPSSGRMLLQVATRFTPFENDAVRIKLQRSAEFGPVVNFN